MHAQPTPHERAFAPAPDAHPELVPGELHVWAIALDGPEPASDVALDAEERERARRFQFDVHRRRFLAAHVAVRTLLGRYLQVAPADVRFVKGPRGKPALADHPELHFNQSDSGELALFAIGRDASVGVDLELMRPLDSVEQLARRVFSESERAELAATTSPEERALAFYRGWARKEAFVKATGEGVWRDFAGFDVSLALEPRARLLAMRDVEDRVEDWTLEDLHPDPDFAAAFALRAKLDAVRRWVFGG